MGGEIAPTADTVVELVRQQAARFGEKIAFSFSYCGDGREGSQLTYRELDARARGIGAGAAGAGPPTPAGIWVSSARWSMSFWRRRKRATSRLWASVHLDDLHGARRSAGRHCVDVDPARLGGLDLPDPDGEVGLGSAMFALTDEYPCE